MNSSLFLTTEEQKKTIDSIKALVPGKLYTMEYTADYKLDEFINSGAVLLEDFTKFAAVTLLDGRKIAAAQAAAAQAAQAEPMKMNDYNSGCSAFCGFTEAGDPLYCRGYDFPHQPTALFVHTHPRNGYRSIGGADLSFMNIHEGMLEDGKTDLSALMLAPYVIVDGVNEKGVAIAALALKHNGVNQNTGKTKIPTTVIMRTILDRAASTDEAIDIFKSYDICTNLPNRDFHFLINDANGISKVVEYVNQHINVFDARCLNNQYMTPYMSENVHEPRFEVLNNFNIHRQGRFEVDDAMAMLRCIRLDEYMSPDELPAKSHTLWSYVANLKTLSIDLCFSRDYDHRFKLEV